MYVCACAFVFFRNDNDLDFITFFLELVIKKKDQNSS